MKIRQFLRGFLPKPRRRFSLFQIEPTSNCNLNCIMCPWTELHTGKSDMSWEVFEKIAEYFPYSEGVDFTGTGEPLLHPDLMQGNERDLSSGNIMKPHVTASGMHG